MGKRYFLTDGTHTIPTTATGLRKLAEAGCLSPTDRVLVEGMSEWVPASRLKGLFPAATAPTVGTEPAVEADELLPDSEPLPGPVARATLLAWPVRLAKAVPVQPAAAEAQQPAGAIDRMCGWVAEQVQARTGVEVSAEAVKAVGGLALAAAAVQMATNAAGGGGSSSGGSGGMGRHEERTTSQIMQMEGIINAGGTPYIKYF